ncbi:MAG: hypothetical protein ABIT36_11260 [Steroidobacteraceae bacterium]
MPANRKSSAPEAGPRLRRAYFEVRYGQLHVHHAIPPGGGFDERTTLICLPDSSSSARALLPLLAQFGLTRSVYAADLPGTGESDMAPDVQLPESAVAAIGDFIADMRLRQMDVLGVGAGAAVARLLAVQHAGLIRRVVAIGEVAGARPSSGRPAQPLLELPALEPTALAQNPALGEFLK